MRKGLKAIVVENVADPLVPPQHVLIQTHYSLISTGTESASIHNEGVLKEVAENPSHLKVVWEALKVHGLVRTTASTKQE